MPCRIKKRQIWTHRIVLESCCHQSNSFITLTYAEEHYPKDGSLNKRDYVLYLKRLRELTDYKIRYFFVGEYGDRTERAHYHAAIFGLGPEHTEILEQAWGLGFVHVGDLNAKSAQYLAGYVTKKMTRKDDIRLNGRHPEFSQPSLKPGIGALAVPDIEKVLTSEYGVDVILAEQDVPSFLLMGTKRLPLGGYLKRKIRERLGFHDVSTPKEKLREINKDLYALFEEGLKELPWKVSRSYKETLWEEFLKKQMAQKILNLEAKQHIFKKRGSV